MRPELEPELKAAGLTGPRITAEGIEANIIGEHYFTGEEAVVGQQALLGTPFEAGDIPDREHLGRLTFCVLVCRNRFPVVGISASASVENFRAEMGRKFARQDAVRQLGTLMAYELRTKLEELSST